MARRLRRVSTTRSSVAVALGIWLGGCATEYGSPVLERAPGTAREAGVAASPATGGPAPGPQARPESYTVQKGETLFGIAKRFGVPYKELAEWNGLDGQSSVKVGQQLRLSPPDSPVVAYAVKVDAPPEGKVVPDEPMPAKPVESKAPAGVPGLPGPVPPGVVGAAGAGTTVANAAPSASSLPPTSGPAAASPSTAGAGPQAPAQPPPAGTEGTAVPDGPVKSEPKAVKLPYSAAALAQLQKSAAASQDQQGADAAKAPAAARQPGAAAAGAKAEAALKAEAPSKAAGDKSVSDAGADGERLDWVWPTQGKVASAFTESTKGIALAGAPGQPVVASAGGLVTYVGSDLRGYGRMVVIKHNKTFLSVYTNNSQVLVKEGQTVARGQKIAEMGGGGDGDTVALHFEIRRLGKPVDPMKYLPNDRS